MPSLNAADLVQIRSRPIGRKWKLYVYQPVRVWQGRVGGSPSQGDTELEVTTVSGNPADILADMTCWVTTAAGSSKMWPSKVRVKNYAAGAPNVLTVAENSIDWLAAPGDLVNVMRLWEPWPRIPYITPDGVQWKDRTIAWASDAQAQPPKANAGPAAIADLTGASVDIVFKNESSFSCPSGGGVSAYLWTAYGGSPAVVAGGLATSTVTLRYTTAGYYYVRLRVTDANGQYGYRYVPVIVDDGTLRARYEVPGDRSWDRHGWVLSRNVLSIASEDDDTNWYDGAPLFLVADDTQVATTAFADNRSNLRWSGWLIEDTTRRNRQDRDVDYRAVSTAHVLGNIPAFPVGLRSSASPSDWYEFTDLSIDSVAYLLLRWHSTLDVVADYLPVGEWTTRPRPGENCRAEDLLSQINAVLEACKGELRCDRQGIVRAVRHEWFLSAAEEAARATVMSLQYGDFSSVQYGPDQHRAQVREVRASGVDGTGEPFISGSPGRSPLDGGRPSEVQRLAPLNQSELNQWAGQQLGYENHQARARLKMSGEFDAVDPAYGEYVFGSLSAFDPRIKDGPYSVTGVRFVDDNTLKYTRAEWELLPRPGMHDADAIPIPPEVPPPEPPPPPIEPPPDPEPKATGEVVIVGTVEAGVCVCFDVISGVPPTWYELNDVLTGSVGSTLDKTFIDDLVINPVAPSFQACCIDGSGEVYVNNDWRNFDYWYLSLTEAEALSLTGWANVNLLQLAAGPDGTLAVVADYWTGADHQTGILISQNWGDPTKILAERWAFVALPYAWQSSGIGGTCSYSSLSDYWTIYNKSVPQPGGQIHLVEINGLIACWMLAKCANSSIGRSNVALNRDIKTPGTSWEVAYRIPFGAAGPCQSKNGWLGGDRIADNEWNGPLGSCVNPDDGYIYIASFMQHEEYAGNRALARLLADGTWGGLDQEYIDTDITTGYGERPGMFFAPAEGSGQEFIALMLEEDPVASGTWYTRIYVNNATNSAYTKRIPERWRVGYSFPLLVDEGQSPLGAYHIIYLGRSYGSATLEKAHDGQQQCFLVCKRPAVEAAMVSAWDDKTGNLYDLGARGITAIQADTESD